MVVSRTCDPSGLVEVTLTGVVTARDQADLVAFVRGAVVTAGTVRVLIRLQQFAAWRFDEQQDDIALWLRDDEGVRQIAIVGELRWRAPLLTFVAHPLRSLPIEYFTTEDAARRWLQGPLHIRASATSL